MSRSGSLSRVLGVRNPWAALIIHGCPDGSFKDVENRSRRTSHRGPLLIHAGLATDPSEWNGKLGEVPSGAIIGVVDLIDCVQDSASEWAEASSWHWLLANPRPLTTPIPARGQLGLWRLPHHTATGRQTA